MRFFLISFVNFYPIYKDIFLLALNNCLFFLMSGRQRELMGKGRILRLTKMSTLESPSQGFLSTSKAILKIVSEPTDNSAKDYALAVRWVHWYSGKRY